MTPFCRGAGRLLNLMDETPFLAGGIDGAADELLAVHATSATPVWWWSPDGTHVLWANPAGCEAFGAPTLSGLAARMFAPDSPPGRHVSRLAATLPTNGTARLERLRGFAGPGSYLTWRPLTCACSRLTCGRTSGVLIAATEAVGPPLSLAERVRRLELDAGAAIAAFAPDGTMLFATAPARDLLGDATERDALMADKLAQAALSTGLASGPTAAGTATIRRFGKGAETVLLVRFVRDEPTPSQTTATGGTGSSPRPVSAPRRHPVRFVWQMDAKGRFTLGSDEFAEIIGERTAFALGRPWRDINAELGLDPGERVAQAIATRETWSGVTVSWPVDGSSERLDVELSGLPAFDRERNFLGYRGFGVCRDLDRIESVQTMRRLLMNAPAEIESAATSETVQPTKYTSASDRRDAAVAIAIETAVARNVVLFPGSSALADSKIAADPKGPMLSPVEHSAFRELARQLTARLQDSETTRTFDDVREPSETAPAAVAAAGLTRSPTQVADASAQVPPLGGRVAPDSENSLLSRLPVGILVYRQDRLLFVNRTLLAWTGYPDIKSLAAAGGIDALLAGTGIGAFTGMDEHGKRIAIATREHGNLPVEAYLFALPWDGEPAFAVAMAKSETDRSQSADGPPRHAAEQPNELRALMSGIADTVVTIDGARRIEAANRAGQALFGRSMSELAGTDLTTLFSRDCRDAVAAHFAHAPPPEGRPNVEATVVARDGRHVPVHMTIIPIDENNGRMSVVLQDVTAFKAAEEAAVAARQQAQSAVADKSEVLNRLDQEARTPLNSIFGFCDLMLGERFGPIGNDRYREYIADVRKSAVHLMSLMTEAAELARIEAGALTLSPMRVSLNALVAECVSEIQSQASEARVIVRTSLAASAPPIVADAGTVRQMIVNLLGHALQSTKAGGQLIVSTATGPNGDVILRVRHNGDGLSEAAIASVLRPLHGQEHAASQSAAAPSLALPLTRALAIANQARFNITSKPHDGALFELSFSAGHAGSASKAP